MRKKLDFDPGIKLAEENLILLLSNLSTNCLTIAKARVGCGELYLFALFIGNFTSHFPISSGSDILKVVIIGPLYNSSSNSTMCFLKLQNNFLDKLLSIPLCSTLRLLKMGYTRDNMRMRRRI